MVQFTKYNTGANIYSHSELQQLGKFEPPPLNLGYGKVAIPLPDQIN